ncbi:hypothetical protein EKN56_17840 [Limnobaculum zhutongyuii]|uniref:Uncharacterized protein n=1 Tax=Limnobaculum zhutongyuii TaxID=2498113 RepID=A0A411WPK0_9GAMM|nr:hypothetical protein EKN56_17840 [Limnobaculum zhutongyuii]TQS86225.1 hypothetical protein ELQ32_20025 [Limnobaculum zhutongyuii]
MGTIVTKTIASCSRYFLLFPVLWITLCASRYKVGFCCGMQQTEHFSLFISCRRRETPYNAPPSNGDVQTYMFWFEFS